MKRPVKFFDLFGIVSVLVFAGVVAVDSGALRAMSERRTLAEAESSPALDFRDGVAWYGLYIEDERIGFSRIEQRRRNDRLHADSHMVMKPVVFGNPIEIAVQLGLELDPEMRPLAFDLRLDTGSSTIEASGTVHHGRLDLHLLAGPVEQRSTLDIGNATVDIGLRPAFMRSSPEIGDRSRFTVYDPVRMRTVPVEIEYLGRDAIEVLGEDVEAHRMRQYVGDLMLDSWVNDNGEVLKEEMPLGIVAIRETEAAATYGFGRGAPAPPPETISPEDLRDVVMGIRRQLEQSATGEETP